MDDDKAHISFSETCRLQFFRGGLGQKNAIGVGRSAISGLSPAIEVNPCFADLVRIGIIPTRQVVPQGSPTGHSPFPRPLQPGIFRTGFGLTSFRQSVTPANVKLAFNSQYSRMKHFSSFPAAQGLPRNHAEKMRFSGILAERQENFSFFLSPFASFSSRLPGRPVETALFVQQSSPDRARRGGDEASLSAHPSCLSPALPLSFRSHLSLNILAQRNQPFMVATHLIPDSYQSKHFFIS